MGAAMAFSPRPASDHLSGRRCLITGATSGIGFQLASRLLACGAEVVGVGRDPSRCRAASEGLARETGNPRVLCEVADLSSQAEIHSLAKRPSVCGRRIDLLIHNAATFSMRRRITPDGIELQLAVNYLSGFLLCALLFPQLSDDGRIIFVSSGSHFGARIRFNGLELPLPRPWIYNGLAEYGRTKLAEILFVRELARRLGPSSRQWVAAADPGLVDTTIGSKGNGPLVRLAWRIRSSRGASARAAAASIAVLAESPQVAGPSGEYWRDGRIAPSSPRSRDREAAARLWAESERLTALTFPGRALSAEPRR